MKILFLVKFFQPFDRGGSEWSTNDLAQNLVKKGHTMTIITPNYGAEDREVKNGIEIVRMPFPIKLRHPKDTIAPFWTNNLLWFIFSSLYCLRFAIKNRPHIIHIQNNEFIPAGVIASMISNIPSVITFRDYQALCNLGFCLWKSDKACHFKNYIKKDFNFFYHNYIDKKNVLKYLILMFAVLRAKFMQEIVKICVSKATLRVAVSKKVADIFKSNRININKVIHNVVNISSNPSTKLRNEIIYVGKLSKGKGVDMLSQELPSLTKILKGVVFKIIGSGHLEKDLKKIIKVNNLSSKVLFTGQLDHEKVLKEIKTASLVIIPSIWQEPLSRSLIETLLSGTPVVATNVGGSEEIVKKEYGLLVDPNPNNLRKSIVQGFLKKDKFKQNLLKDLRILRNHFSNETTYEYEKVYQNLAKINK